MCCSLSCSQWGSPQFGVSGQDQWWMDLKSKLQNHHCWLTQDCKMWRFNHILPPPSFLNIIPSLYIPNAIFLHPNNHSKLIIYPFLPFLHPPLCFLDSPAEFCFSLTRNLCLIALVPYFSVLKGYPGLITLPRKCAGAWKSCLTVGNLRNWKYFTCCWNKSEFWGFPW